MQAGDSNTRAFHQAATSRKKKNKITRLLGEDDYWYDSSNGVENIVVSYFREIFRSEQGQMAEVIEAIQPRVSVDQNSFLCFPFSLEEICDAVFDRHPAKSP